MPKRLRIAREHWSWKELVEAEDRTGFVQTPVEPCMICTEGDA